MSNLIKSGFVTLSQDQTLIIDPNKHKIIQNVDESIKENIKKEQSVEEAIAEEMIHDAGLSDMVDENILTVDRNDFEKISNFSEDELNEKADEILQSAKDEAAQIISDAHDEIEKMRAASFDEIEQLKEKSKEEGYQEGRSLAEKELLEKKEEFEKYKQEQILLFEEDKDKFLLDTENKMIDFLCNILPKLTGMCIDHYKSVLLYLINSAMKDLDNSKNFIIKVSSCDYPDIFQRKDEIYGAMNPNIDLEIFQDAKLDKNQCLIETDNGIVDVSLDVQLQNLIRVLRLMKQE